MFKISVKCLVKNSLEMAIQLQVFKLFIFFCLFSFYALFHLCHLKRPLLAKDKIEVRAFLRPIQFMCLKSNQMFCQKCHSNSNTTTIIQRTWNTAYFFFCFCFQLQLKSVCYISMKGWVCWCLNSFCIMLWHKAWLWFKFLYSN